MRQMIQQLIGEGQVILRNGVGGVLILVMQATNNPTMKRFFGSVREKLMPKRKERAAL